MIRLQILALLSALLGCRAVHAPPETAATPATPATPEVQATASCESVGVTLPAGFADAPGVPLPSWPTAYAPVQAPWNGGVQHGESCVAQTTGEVVVYRVFGGPAGQMGYWWSPSNPTTRYGGASEWRSANAVCASFNDATQLAACTLPTGTAVYLGPTQSIVTVTDGAVSCLYPANDVALQINLTKALPDTTPCTVEDTPPEWRSK